MNAKFKQENYNNKTDADSFYQRKKEDEDILYAQIQYSARDNAYLIIMFRKAYIGKEESRSEEEDKVKKLFESEKTFNEKYNDAQRQDAEKYKKSQLDLQIRLELEKKYKNFEEHLKIFHKAMDELKSYIKKIEPRINLIKKSRKENSKKIVDRMNNHVADMHLECFGAENLNSKKSFIKNINQLGAQLIEGEIRSSMYFERVSETIQSYKNKSVESVVVDAKEFKGRTSPDKTLESIFDAATQMAEKLKHDSTLLTVQERIIEKHDALLNCKTRGDEVLNNAKIMREEYDAGRLDVSKVYKAVDHYDAVDSDIDGHLTEMDELLQFADKLESLPKEIYENEKVKTASFQDLLNKNDDDDDEEDESEVSHELPHPK